MWGNADRNGGRDARPVYQGAFFDLSILPPNLRDLSIELHRGISLKNLCPRHLTSLSCPIDMLPVPFTVLPTSIVHLELLVGRKGERLFLARLAAHLTKLESLTILLCPSLRMEDPKDTIFVDFIGDFSSFGASLQLSIRVLTEHCTRKMVRTEKNKTILARLELAIST